jgi:segregation and condensation protein A
MNDPTFKLEGIVKVKENMEDFEGPLTLILTLLSKNKIEIKDIQISSLLDQYLEYIESMKAMDLEVASEFVAMASHLVYIKARTVLRSSEEEEVDELEELKSSLAALQNKDKYTQIKEVSEWLETMFTKGGGTFVRKQETLPPRFIYAYEHEAADLLVALDRAFTETNQAPPSENNKRIAPTPIVFSVTRKTAEILTGLRDRGVMSLDDLLRMSKSRSELVATFISVLELCKSGAIVIFGNEDDLSVALGDETTDDTGETEDTEEEEA